MSEKAKEQYELLLDILELCEIYYDEQEFEDRKDEYIAYYNVSETNEQRTKSKTNGYSHKEYA